MGKINIFYIFTYLMYSVNCGEEPKSPVELNSKYIWANQTRNNYNSTVSPIVLNKIAVQGNASYQLIPQQDLLNSSVIDSQHNITKNVLNDTLKPGTKEFSSPIDDVDFFHTERAGNMSKYNETIDHHDFYNSSIIVNNDKSKTYWNSFKDISHNPMLSTSHRRAVTLQLTFPFPFYGHNIRNITVATGGFMYTGEYVHSWLAATQYIAPLMANFDTSLSNSSFVKYLDNGTSFTVVWENVYLQDKMDIGAFTFSATLYDTGNIVFVYYNVPILIESIHDDKHPVKVGLSDAYIIDKVIFFSRRKTIYEYHRVNFGSDDIQNSTIIQLTALPTCLTFKDCNSCLESNSNFQCSWCPTLNRCSTGIDRRRQEWLQKGCDQRIDDRTCSSQNNNHKYDIETSSVNTNMSPAKLDDVDNNINKKPSATSFNLILGIIIPVAMVITVLIWILYAFRNPHTKSGQLLIQVNFVSIVQKQNM
ncbi:PLXDC2 family protein [Megaselia abdita]